MCEQTNTPKLNPGTVWDRYNVLMPDNDPCVSMLQETSAWRFCAFINNSMSQEAHSIRMLQVETCRGLACHKLCVGHCYAWIWTSVYNSHGGLSLCLHALANLGTYILNLHAQSRATVCTLHGNMYSSSMCAQFHGTFKYCYFFEQVFSTKMAINLAFLRV